MEITHIKLMIKKAIPFFLVSGSDFGIISKSRNKVFVALHANTTISPRFIAKAEIQAPGIIWCIKNAFNKLAEPDNPPEIKAVLALKPMKIIATIPQQMRNTP